MKKLIIFDLDGTLVNSIYDLADAVNDSLIELGYPTHELDKFYHFVGNGTVKLSERALPEEHRSKAEIQRLHKLFSEKYQKCCLNKTLPYDGIKQALKSLKSLGLKCAVASNKPDNFVKYIVDNLFEVNTFDIISGKREGIPPKPDPQIIAEILRQLKIDRQDTVFAGDSDVDVITAHNANIPCIGCVWGFRGQQELIKAGADYLAATPLNISEIVKNI